LPTWQEPVKIVITGGAGQIAYSLLPPLASGAVFGMDQPVILHLLDIPPAITALGGVVMELEDLAYPLLAGVLGTTDPDEAFKDVDYAIFLGAFPRKEGMERKDVMTKNIGIFNSQGSALSKGAKPGVKCVVVGNPANTNAAILARAAPNVDPKNISALTRLDHNRASSHLAIRCGVSCDKVSGVIIWGNHSSTQYPDVRHATVDGKPAREVCTDAAWIEGEYITKVQKRGAAIIEARKLSSAASAAKAICDHMRDWVIGTGDGYVSMAVKSDGSHYGVPEGLFYSMPVKCSGGEWTVVDGLPIDEFSQGKMTATANELSEELALALSLL
jgi:malate dehydrogenase